MAIFIVRVQLTKEDNSHYTLLRDRLIVKGFTKRIRDSHGIEYRLPNGNYLIETEDTIAAVFNVVSQVAHTVDKTPMILVTKAAPKGNMWSGLQRC